MPLPNSKLVNASAADLALYAALQSGCDTTVATLKVAISTALAANPSNNANDTIRIYLGDRGLTAG